MRTTTKKIDLQQKILKVMEQILFCSQNGIPVYIMLDKELKKDTALDIIDVFIGFLTGFNLETIQEDDIKSKFFQDMIRNLSKAPLSIGYGDDISAINDEIAVVFRIKEGLWIN